MTTEQASELKFRLRELTSWLCYAAAWAVCVCFEGRMAGLDQTQIGNELSQPKFEFTSLGMTDPFLRVRLIHQKEEF